MEKLNYNKFIVQELLGLPKKCRNATPEERKSVQDYVDSISQPTGVNFWDLTERD